MVTKYCCLNMHEINTQRLNSVNRFLHTHVQWTPLVSAATTNHLFKAAINGKQYILRLNAEDNLAFGVSRKKEAKVLNLIKKYNWAPEVIQNNWQEGWCLMLDHGPTINTRPLPVDHQEIGSALLEAMSEWQIIHPDSRSHNQCIFDYTQLFENYRHALNNASNNASSHDNLHLIDKVEHTLNTLPSAPHSLTHHDLHPGNICKEDNQLVILDWEYAGIGNPWFDAAALYSKFGVLEERIAILPAFMHLDNMQIKQGIIDAVELTESLETLWFAVRNNN